MKIKSVDSKVMDTILDNIEMSTGVSKISQEILGVFQDEQGMTLVGTKWFTQIDLEEDDPLYKKMADQLDKFVPDWREFDLLMEDDAILRSGESLAGNSFDSVIARQVADQVKICLDLATSSTHDCHAMEMFVNAAKGHLCRLHAIVGGEDD
jgi:hypothetical protein